ncbi:MAG TPA: NAD(P)-dependent oxidoreductase [Solirubrobacteraceae bacterium]|nr:NAD(P)-dependent oxidoreductase [Solirubrobacteraceae bacterium]
MSKVLVTGAGGYIGGRLVRALAGAGRDVHALVREPAPWLGIDQTVCDLCSAAPELLAEACAGVSTIVHLAGENELVAAREPAGALGSTVIATERLAEAARAAGGRRLVYLSTVHVYGERMRPGVTLTEDLRPEPRSAYAISRLACEHVAASLSTETVILRLTNTVGAPADAQVDRWSLVANDLARQGTRQGTLRLRSSGVQWRDFVPLDDVCAAIGAAGDRSLAPGTYNLGSGEPTTVLALAHLVQDAFEQRTGRRPPLQTAPPPPEPSGPYRVSVQRIAAQGVTGSRTLGDAVGETVAFCLEHREELG